MLITSCLGAKAVIPMMRICKHFATGAILEIATSLRGRNDKLMERRHLSILWLIGGHKSVLWVKQTYDHLIRHVKFDSFHRPGAAGLPAHGQGCHRPFASQPSSRGKKCSLAFERHLWLVGHAPQSNHNPYAQ